MNEHIGLLARAKTSWLYPIYVPSAYRAGSAPLLNMLRGTKPSVQHNITIVTLPSQAKAYRKAYPQMHVITESAKGIGPARMRCLIHAQQRGLQNIVVLDDDIIHVSLLERQEDKQHTRRYSAKVSGIREPFLLLRSLAVGCRIASVLFEERTALAYGAARNALFSGAVDPSVAATINKGSFPACVMFFDVDRFQMRKMPVPYRHHGEDLAMFLHTLSEGQEAFTLPGVAYDQHGSIESTIPLDPQDEVGRPHLQTTERYYPAMHPYLRVSMKNKLGGVMRIGVNWSRFYKATGLEPVEIPLTTIMKEI